MAVFLNKLVVAGSFTQVNGIPANNIAQWDGTTWSAMGSGLNDGVFDVHVHNGVFYATGAFTHSGMTEVNRIARWNGTSWFPVGTGLNSSISPYSVGRVLASFNNELYVGGTFATAGGNNAYGLARWNGNVWSNVGMVDFSGFLVYALAVHGAYLYAGGSFNSAGGVEAEYIARWNGTQWAPVGQGVLGVVEDLLVDGDHLYATGQFTQAGGAPAQRVARYHPATNTWSAMGAGIGNTVFEEGFTLGIYNGNVVVGGTFDNAGAVAVQNVAQWNGTAWSTLANGLEGSIVTELQIFNGSLYAGGITDQGYLLRLDPMVQIGVQAKVILSAAYDATAGNMMDALRQLPDFPLTEPYTALGYPHVEGGGESTTASVLAVGGAQAVVDWVVLELRTSTSPSLVLYSRSALLRRDGSIVDVDGSSPVQFTAAASSYHLGIRHRNHLGVMTAAAVPFVAGMNPSIDLTMADTPTWGNSGRKNINGTLALWPGDVTFDHMVRYTGAGNDRDPILQAIGGVIPTATVSNIYSSADTNLDGTIRYTGLNNDRDHILQTIDGLIPTAVRYEQLP